MNPHHLKDDREGQSTSLHHETLLAADGQEGRGEGTSGGIVWGKKPSAEPEISLRRLKADNRLVILYQQVGKENQEKKKGEINVTKDDPNAGGRHGPGEKETAELPSFLSKQRRKRKRVKKKGKKKQR